MDNRPMGNPSRPGLNAPAGQAAVNTMPFVDWIKGQEHLAALGNQALVDQADKLGKLLAEEVRLNTTQIRKVLARVNALNARLHNGFSKDEVPLLKVQLVYAAAREKAKVGPLADVLLAAIDRIHDETDYRWFARFVEAIVAYHRFHGGKNE